MKKTRLVAALILFVVFLEIFLRLFFTLGYNLLSFKIIAPLSVNINSLREKVLSDDRFFSTKHPELGFVIKPNIDISYQAKEISKDIPSVSYKTVDVFGDGTFGARDDGIDKKLWAIAIGDSYTFCYSIEMNRCWVEIIENETGKDVLNLGTPGTGTYQQYKILEYFLRRYNQKPEFVFLMFNFTDYLDDQCYLHRKNCNIFSPNTSFLFEDTFLGNFYIIGALKTVIDSIQTRRTYSYLMEPEASYLKNIKDVCSCEIILIPAYNYVKNLRICSSYNCVRLNYTEDMFMKEHHNEKAQDYIAKKVIEYLKNNFKQNFQE